MITKQKQGFGALVATTGQKKGGLATKGGLGRALSKTGASLTTTGNTTVGIPKRADSRVTDKVAERGNKIDVGRICFVIDATGSRSKAWEEAQQIQARMFEKISSIGAIELGIVCHRGARVNHLGWFDNGDSAKSSMAEIDCQKGHTRIARSLEEALIRDDGRYPSSIIMVGDCCEEYEGDVQMSAQKVAAAGTKVFSFLDTRKNHDHGAEHIYRMVANITGGSFSEFGADMPLQDLCHAVAVRDVGGKEAFERLLREGNKAAKALQQGASKMLGHDAGYLSGPEIG